MKPVSLAIIGAGSRGRAYADYAAKFPAELKICAVAEPREKARERIVSEHNISPDTVFEDYRDFFRREKFCDAVAVATMDREHFKPAVAALEKGYKLLLEKPMSTDPSECSCIAEAEKKYNGFVQVAHVLRYTPFFRKIKDLLDSGAVGKIISIDHIEGVEPVHFSHSYVRGRFSKTEEATFILMAKSCHDIDIIAWLMGQNNEAETVSSFGNLSYFRGENAPPGSPERCIEGCPHSMICQYNAMKVYLGEDSRWGRHMSLKENSEEAKFENLRTGNYGRCVFKCGNDVMDHQVCAIQFADKATATFTLTAFDVGRHIRINGTLGTIKGAIDESKIEVRRFSGDEKWDVGFDYHDYSNSFSSHRGGDYAFMKEFIYNIRHEKMPVSNAAESLRTHLITFALEKSRLEKRVVSMRDEKD